jgi:hypothetical protein
MTLDQLLADAPALHGPAGGGDLLTHGLLDEALGIIDRTISAGDRTLETGSGYSTILFALKSARHTCVVPQGQEVERIRAYCDARGISTDGGVSPRAVRARTSGARPRAARPRSRRRAHIRSLRSSLSGSIRRAH